MNYEHCIIEFEFPTGKKGIVIASKDLDYTLLQVDGKQLQLDEPDARQVYRNAKELWKLVGMVPISRTVTPYGPNIPRWGNIATFPGITVSLIEMRWHAWRWKPNIDDGSFTEWVLELSFPIEDLSGVRDDNGYWTDEFCDLLLHYLADHLGFQGESDHVLPGEGFVRVGFDLDKDNDRRVTVTNHHLRNV